MKCFTKWKEQKQNNRGSTLAVVIMTIALVGILVTMILSITLMNFRMKQTNLKSQMTFYTAEEALDEVKQGLVSQISAATAEAYVYTMAYYNSLTPDNRSVVFQEQIVTKMRDAICLGALGTSNLYDVSKLSDYLVETSYDSTTNIGAVITAPTNGNYMNITQDAIVLKNVIVTYYGADDYYSQIQTDIVISFPVIDFSQKSGAPDLLSYSLIANDNFEIVGANNVEVSGNSYLGKSGAVVKNATVTFKNTELSEDMDTLVTNKGISVIQGSTLSIDGMEVWANSIAVDASKADITGEVYLNNDLVVSNSIFNPDGKTKPLTSLTMSGKFYGYGNPENIVNASSMTANIAEIEANPADYSSSIIINGSNATVDLSGLDTMIISGNSYVGGTKNPTTSDTYVVSSENKDVLMGESLSLKTNQTAYLIPNVCIAPEYRYGLLNPMPASQYELLKQELLDDGKTISDIVDYTVKIESLGNHSLSELGVWGFQTEYYSINNYGSMVYFFMVFNTQSDANAFVKSYYDVAGNMSKLNANLGLYTNNILVPSDLKGDVSTLGSRFYFNGSLIAYEGSGDSKVSKIYLNSSAENITSIDNYLSVQSDALNYQDTFAALQHKLTRKYYQLSDEERNNDVYDNLVKSMSGMTEPHAQIGSGGSKTFISSEFGSTPIAAVVVNGDYTITNSTAFSGTDANGNSIAGAKLCLVIASGNVTVESDFEGLIIAGEGIKIQNAGSGKHIWADSATVGLALTIPDANGVTPADYLYDAGNYTIGGSVITNATGETIDYSELITYENWKKQ